MSEMKMTRRELDAEIGRLQAERRKLEEQERVQHQEQARKFVGKCYRDAKGQVLRIIGIPITKYQMTGSIYNKYWFPAMLLRYPTPLSERMMRDTLDEFSPLCIDEVYFNIENGTPVGDFCSKYTEITQEEFREEFDKCINHFKELIGV